MTAPHAAAVLSGQRLLGAVSPASEALAERHRFFSAYCPQADYADDVYIWLTGILALKALAEGNFGVGCILVDGQGNLVAQGHNEIFSPYFRSDRHAEMVVMNRFESGRPLLAGLERYRLYTSLEPCPMCTVRLSSSGIGNILYAAEDIEGGMVRRYENLPPFWRDLAARKNFTQAQCSPELIKAAGELFSFNLPALTAKLEDRR